MHPDILPKFLVNIPHHYGSGLLTRCPPNFAGVLCTLLLWVESPASGQIHCYMFDQHLCQSNPYASWPFHQLEKPFHPQFPLIKNDQFKLDDNLGYPMTTWNYNLLGMVSHKYPIIFPQSSHTYLFHHFPLHLILFPSFSHYHPIIVQSFSQSITTNCEHHSHQGCFLQAANQEALTQQLLEELLAARQGMPSMVDLPSNIGNSVI